MRMKLKMELDITYAAPDHSSKRVEFNLHGSQRFKQDRYFFYNPKIQ